MNTYGNLKRSSGRGALIGLVCVLVLALLIVGAQLVRGLLDLSYESEISLLVSAIETIGLLVSLIIALRQLSGSREIARATFLVELNKAYVENPEYIALYNVLQTMLDTNCTLDEACTLTGRERKQFTKSLVSNYLTFFETIYLLIQNEVVTFAVVDDLFAYRFFLAAHSRLVQEMKLGAQPENFVNIYRLEREWLAYRRRAGKPVGEDTVYGTRRLETLVSAEKYAALTGRKG